jgi:hypothetical protein
MIDAIFQQRGLRRAAHHVIEPLKRQLGRIELRDRIERVAAE